MERIVFACVVLILSCKANDEPPILKESGCCFDESHHAIGEVILEIKESCLNLVCAADLSEPTRGRIIYVQIPPVKCNGGLTCSDCYDTSCVDESGIIRLLGTTWMPNDCFHCECTPGQEVVCRGLPVACEPQPSPTCVKIPGPCCPKWDCGPDQCFDEQGIAREINEVWGGPCIFHICTANGIATRIEDCPPMPKLNDTCELYTPEGNCCPEIRCGCFDEQGIAREINEVWGGPCIFHICTANGIATRIEDCPPVPKLNDTCELYTPEGNCCPEIRCGCVDDQGLTREIDEVWGGPCIIRICTAKGIATRIEDCPPEPLLNDTCELFTPVGKCCPEVRCGCFDDQGVFREINEEWGGPCLFHVCTPSGVASHIIHCVSPPALNESCEYIISDGKCCPEIQCGCTDDQGIPRKLNETWGSPCEQHTCTTSGVVTYVVDCFPISPLNDSCFRFTPVGECCPQVQCGDDCPISATVVNGVLQRDLDCPAIGEAPYPNCEIYTPPRSCCPELRCGIDCRLVRCGITPRPSDHCFLYTPHLGCCQEWNCGDGCTDTEGNYRQLGEVWEMGSCKRLTCTEDGIVAIGNACALEPRPHDYCLEVIPDGKCCPEWNCSLDCSLVLCEGPPANSVCSAMLKENSCCPTYNCSLCFGSGKIYTVGEKWNGTNCTEKECTHTGIKESRVNCPLTEKPDPSCSLTPVLGECCPQWSCGLNCAAVLCQAPPHESCIVHEPPPGECCSTFTCPLDPTGTCVLGTIERRDCKIFTCTDEGPKVEVEECFIEQPSGEDCELRWLEGQCCVQWVCSRGRSFPEETEVLIPFQP